MRLPKRQRRIIQKAVHKARQQRFPGIPTNAARRFIKRLRDSHLRWIAHGIYSIQHGAPGNVESAITFYFYFKKKHEKDPTHAHA